MTEPEAKVEARRRWGARGFIRKTTYVKENDPFYEVGIKNGEEYDVHGCGSSMAAAFKDVDHIAGLRS